MHLGVCVAHDFVPSTQVTRRFSTQEKDPINGNDFIASAFGPNVLRRHREFKAF